MLMHSYIIWQGYQTCQTTQTKISSKNCALNRKIQLVSKTQSEIGIKIYVCHYVYGWYRQQVNLNRTQYFKFLKKSVNLSF